MIELLINKATDKKYHQSLRYFSHSLKGEKRAAFIKELAEKDIFLASQCVMSSERSLNLENYLADYALNQSNSIIVELKVKGILSLIELNRYELIYSALSKTTKIDKEYRYAINQIVGELDRDNIIKLIDVILKTKTKGLVSSVIASVDNRDIEFSFDQKNKLESLFPLMTGIYGRDNQRSLKYLKVFGLSKKLIPSDINRISELRLKKGAYQFIKEFYSYYEIPFPFSPKELCEIYLKRNTQTNALAFAQSFFDTISDEIKFELISKALQTGKYFAAFVISLLKSSKDRQNAILLSPDVLVLRRLIKPFKFVEYPNLDQDKLIEIINKTYRNRPEINGRIVTCKVTGTIPKTIFVDILPEKAKGTIWVREFTKSYIDDIGKIVRIGDTLSAVVIGIGEKYVQLSVRQLTEK
jgi:hypothetical protein